MDEATKAALHELEAMKVWIEGRIENLKLPHCTVCGAVMVPDKDDPERLNCLCCGAFMVVPL